MKAAEKKRMMALIEKSAPEGPRRNALILRMMYGRDEIHRRDFIQDYFYIEHKITGHLVKCVYNPVQRILEAWQLRCERAGIPKRANILKSRHHGVSTWFLANELELVIRGQHMKACIVAQDDDTAATLLDTAKVMRDRLPWDLPHKYDNRSIVYFDDPIRGWIDIKTAQSAKRAKGGENIGRMGGMGRGHHYRSQHFSEIAFYPDPEAVFVNLSQNIPDDPGTMVTMESTANGAGGWWYDYWWKSEQKKNDFTAFFFPWTITPDLRRPCDAEQTQKILDSLDDEEKVLVAKLGADIEQLEWRRWAIENKCGGSVDMFHQEYPAHPEEAFISSGRPAFSHSRISRVRVACEEPIWRGRLITRKHGVEYELVADPGGPLKLWAHPEPDKSYCMGSDTSEGVGQDNSGVTVAEVQSGCQVATFKDGTLNPDEFGRVAACLGRHFNEAYWLPEVNKEGMGTLQAAQDLDYPNILMQPIYGKAGAVVSRRWGWKTHGESKYLLAQEIHHDLARAEVDGEVHIIDEDLVRELFACQLEPGECFAAPRGAHDDLVICWALTCKARRFVYEEGEIEPPPPEPKTHEEYMRDQHWQEFEDSMEEEQEWADVVD